MNVSSTRELPGVATITVEVPIESFAEAYEKAWKRIAARTNVPGFRRGKAPRALVERQVGVGTVNEEAVNHLIPDSYDKAIAELQLSPIERPKFDVVSFEPEQPLVFTATVALRPEVTLGDYSTVARDVKPIVITDEQVDNVIRQLRESRATWEVVEGVSLGMGMQILADLVMDLGDSEEGASRKTERMGTELIIGENGFPPGFDTGVDGMTSGTTRTFAVIWPSPQRSSDEGPTAVEPREALFTVTVHEIRSKVLPEVDDAFIALVSEGQFSTVESLTHDVRERLRLEAIRTGHTQAENDAVDAAIALCEFEIPQRLIDMETDYLVDEERRAYERRRITLERYLELTGQDMETFRAQVMTTADRQIKARTMLDAISERESIEVPDTDIDREIAETVAQYPTDATRVRRELRAPESRRRISTTLRRHKAIEKLVLFSGGYPTLAAGDAVSDGDTHELGHDHGHDHGDSV